MSKPRPKYKPNKEQPDKPKVLKLHPKGKPRFAAVLKRAASPEAAPSKD